MGQQHSNLSHLPNVDYQPECTVLEKTHDPHYGEIKIVREIKSAEKMILKEIILHSKEAFESEAGPFIKRTKSRHPNIVEILGFGFREKHKFCSSYFKISIYIEDISETLLNQLDSRKATGVSFTDNEILYIAHSLLSGLSHLQSQGLYHGDVRPFNVFSRERAYKLSDPILSAQKGSNGLTMAIFHNTKTLLAPELLSHVPQRRFDISSDPNKADVFSLGATLLCLATLADSEDFYDHHRGVIKNQILTDRLETVRLTYSEFTYEFLRDMLMVNPHQRPDIQGLLNRLLPYQDQIRAGYLNPSTPMGNFSSSLVEFTFAGAKTEGELIKKSARLPVDTIVESQRTYQDTVTDHPIPVIPANDDLDARIKAALERSQATFSSFKKEEAPYASTTNKNVERLKSSVPQTVTRESYSNYPLTTSYYPPASTYQYVAPQTQTTQPLAGENNGLYASYRASNPINDYNNTNLAVSGRNTENERALKPSVPQNVEYHTFKADPLPQYNTNYPSTNYYTSTNHYANSLTTPLITSYGVPETSGVSYSEITKRAENEKALKSSVPASTNAYSSTYLTQPVTNSNVYTSTYTTQPVNNTNAYRYSTTTPQDNYNTTTYGGNLGLYSSAQASQDRYFEPPTNISARNGGISNTAVGGATNVNENFGYGGFTEQLNRVSLGENQY